MTASEVVLRRALEDDSDAVASVYLRARKAAAMPVPVHTDNAIRSWLDGRVHSDEVWVAEVEGTVAAYLRLTDDWLDDLYVVPERTREGIGSALLDLAKARRPDGFALWVFASNAPARGFYGRRGLVELEHTDGSGNEERSPDLRMAWPGADPIAFLRREIDDVDDELARLLARRFALSAAVQGYKRPAGQAGRDPDREREIALRMAQRAPALGADRVARIMHTVIAESLDAAAP